MTEPATSPEYELEFMCDMHDQDEDVDLRIAALFLSLKWERNQTPVRIRWRELKAFEKEWYPIVKRKARAKIKRRAFRVIPGGKHE
jgi:hypothetical protein